MDFDSCQNSSKQSLLIEMSKEWLLLFHSIFSTSELPRLFTKKEKHLLPDQKQSILFVKGKSNGQLSESATRSQNVEDWLNFQICP